MWFIGTIISIFNNMLQTNSFKNYFLWKNQNYHKRTHNTWVLCHCWFIWLWFEPLYFSWYLHFQSKHISPTRLPWDVTFHKWALFVYLFAHDMSDTNQGFTKAIITCYYSFSTFHNSPNAFKVLLRGQQENPHNLVWKIRH